MAIDISLGDFHRTHHEAHEAEKLVRGGTSGVSDDDLREALASLRDGQRLTDAETGPDFMYASDYSEAIGFAEAELQRRGCTP